MKQEDIPRSESETIPGQLEGDPQLLGLIDEESIGRALEDPRTFSLDVDGSTRPIIVPIEYATEANQDYFKDKVAYFFDWVALKDNDPTGLEDFVASLQPDSLVMMEVREGEVEPENIFRRAARTVGRDIGIDDNVFDTEDGSMAGVEHFVSSVDENEDIQPKFGTFSESYEYLKQTGRWDAQFASRGVHFAEASSLDQELTEALWGVYDATFDKLTERHPSAQKQSKQDFIDQLVRPGSSVTYAEVEGRVASALFMIEDISTCSWINPSFYKKMYPNGRTVFIPGISTSLDMSGLGLSELTIDAMGELSNHVSGIAALATQCTNRSAKYIPDLANQFTERTAKLEMHRVASYKYPVFRLV